MQAIQSENRTREPATVLPQENVAAKSAADLKAEVERIIAGDIEPEQEFDRTQAVHREDFGVREDLVHHENVNLQSGTAQGLDLPKLVFEETDANFFPNPVVQSNPISVATANFGDLPKLVFEENMNEQERLQQEAELLGGIEEDAAPQLNPSGQRVVNDVSSVKGVQLLGQGPYHPLSLNEAIMRAISQSSRIAEFQFNALESQQAAGQELGEFDAAGFLEQRFGQGFEPVGNQFQINDATQNVIESQELEIAGGIRQQTQTGGEYSVRQSVRFFDDDSGILLPPDQAITQLSFNFSQELLRDSGRKVVLNRVLVANLLAKGESAEAVAQIAQHVNDVASAYWALFIARGKVLVTQEQVNFANSIVERVQERQAFDAEKNLVFQARSAMNQFRVDLAQAYGEAKQAQDLLVRLIGDPQLNSAELEIVTTETPMMQAFPIDLQSELGIAVSNRPEVHQAIANIKASQVQHHFTLNQLLPSLSFDLEASLNGLDGNRDAGGSFGNQFDIDPTYQVGFNFEVPFSNLAARFQNREAELVLKRVAAQFRNAVDIVQLDVRVAYHRLEYVNEQIAMLEKVIDDTFSELQVIIDRTYVAPRREDIPSVQLNLLLNAQQRLLQAKVQFFDALQVQQRALIDLKRANGTLINDQVMLGDTGPKTFGLFPLTEHLSQENQAAFGELQMLKSQIYWQNNNFLGQPPVIPIPAQGINR